MNPIPLRAPDGQTYAYACSACRHVGSHGRVMWPDLEAVAVGPIPNLVATSRVNAERCCTCTWCRAPVDSEYHTIECATCASWSKLCRAIGLVSTAYQKNITTKEVWESSWYSCGYYRLDQEDGDE